MDVHPTKNVSIGIDPYPDDQSLFKLDLPLATNYQRLVEKPRLALQENVPVWYGVVNATAVGIFAGVQGLNRWLQIWRSIKKYPAW